MNGYPRAIFKVMIISSRLTSIIIGETNRQSLNFEKYDNIILLVIKCFSNSGGLEAESHITLEFAMCDIF